MAIHTNKREYFRIQLKNALCSDIKIVKVKDTHVNTAKAQVLIDDISAGGVRFLSNLKFLPTPNVILQLETEVLGITLQLHGYITRNNEIEKGIYSYGLKFVHNQKSSDYLIKLLNELAISLRQNQFVKGNFISMDKFNFLKQQHLYA